MLVYTDFHAVGGRHFETGAISAVGTGSPGAFVVEFNNIGVSARAGSGRNLAAGDAHYIGTGNGFGRVALVVLQFAVDDHIGTHGYLRVALYPGSAVKVLDAVAGELGSGGSTVIGDVERGGAVFGVEGKLHGRNLTLHIEGTYFLEVGVGGPGEILHGSHGCGYVVRIVLDAGTGRSAGATALAAAAAFSVDGINVTAGGLRGVALEVHDFGADDDFVILGKFLAAESPLLVVEVEDTEGREHGIVAFVHHGERSVAVLGGKLFGDGLDLTLDIIGVGRSGLACFNGLGNGSSHVERIFQGTGTLGFGSFAAGVVFNAATVHTVKAVDEGGTLANGFGGIALVVVDGAVDDDLVLFLDVGVVVSLGPLDTAQIVGLEHLEDVGRTFLVHDVEDGVAIGAAGLEGGFHGRDDTLYENFRALDIGPQRLHILDGAGHGERFLLGTVSVVNLAVRAHLVDGDGLTGKADGEDDGGATVVSLVLGDRDGEFLSVGIGRAGLLGEGDPIRQGSNGPVAGGDKADILGGDLGLKAYVRGVHGELGGTQVHFFLVTGHEHGCSGQDCQKEFSKFHIRLLLCF